MVHLVGHWVSRAERYNVSKSTDLAKVLNKTSSPVKVLWVRSCHWTNHPDFPSQGLQSIKVRVAAGHVRIMITSFPFSLYRRTSLSLLNVHGFSFSLSHFLSLSIYLYLSLCT